MKRLLAACVIVVAGVVALTTTASGAAGEGPPCADITDISVRFPNDGAAPYTLNAEAELKAPACVGKVAYRLFVRTDAGLLEGRLLGFSPTGNPQFEFSSSDNTICIYAESSIAKSGNVYDRAPNADPTLDCVALTAGVSGGRTGSG